MKTLNQPSNRALLLLTAGTLVCAVGLLLGFSMGDAGAQPAATGSEAWTEGEREAYDLYVEEKYISARTKAEEVLARRADSMVAHFVLGGVLYSAEGALARAMFHLGRARQLYESRWTPSARSEGAPWELHRETLYRIQALAQEMELFEYQIDVLGYHDYLYDPDLLAEHAWPLMQLGRLEEARSFAGRAIAITTDAWQHSAGLNALCAVEGESGEREAYDQACAAAFDNAQARTDGGAVAVHAYNAAVAARAVFNFEAAESHAILGGRRLEFTPANPWRLMVGQYLDQGRFTQVLESLREMGRWRARQPAYLKDQGRAETDAVLATVLLALGESERGLAAISRSIMQPDRRGLTSSQPEQALGAHALLRRALVHAHAERRVEDASAEGIVTRLSGAVEAAAERFGAWDDDERVIAALMDDERLIQTLRPYVRGGIEPVPVWLVGDLVQVLGAGVVAAGLNDARRRDASDPDTPATAYYLALSAEVALHQGNDGEALILARQALERLPATEALLAARVAAIAAEAAREGGMHQEALAFYEEAMLKDAGTLRRLGLSLPARIEGHGSELAREVAEALGRSPRFRDGSGFEIQVTGSGTRVEACLLSPQGARMGCQELDAAQLLQQYEEALAAYEERRGPDDEESAEEPMMGSLEAPEEPNPATYFVRRFHSALFAANVTISSTDMSSLDGTTTTGGDLARERMRELLDQATR